MNRFGEERWVREGCVVRYQDGKIEGRTAPVTPCPACGREADAEGEVFVTGRPRAHRCECGYAWEES